MGLLRFLLALSVVAAHAGPIFGLEFVGPQLAVQSFYIISGFYMSLVLNEKYIGANNSYRLFITNRLIRLYPIYFTVLILTILAFVAVGVVKKQPVTIFEHYQEIKTNFFTLAYLVIAHLIIFGQDAAMFLGITAGSGNLFFTTDFMHSHPPVFSFLFIPQAWTLALELSFYAIAPFIVRKNYKLAVTIIILSALVRLYLYNVQHLDHDPWTYRFFPNEIMFFLLGYLSYQTYLKIKTINIHRNISITIFAGMALFTCIFSFLPSFQPAGSPFSISEISYLAAVTIAIPFLFNFLKKNSLDNKIGELSYPLYICHYLISMMCQVIPFEAFRKGWSVALIAIIFSWALTKGIADPVERFRQSRLKQRAAI